VRPFPPSVFRLPFLGVFLLLSADCGVTGGDDTPDSGTSPPTGGSVCGDARCDAAETCSSCSSDCGACPPPGPVCGNGICETDESCASCSQDCGACSTRTCTNPVFVTSETNGGWSNGGYYVHNNMWNAAEAGPETLYACAYNNWYVDSTQPPTTSVKTYPNVHLDVNNMNGAPLNNFQTITGTFAGQGPRVGIYNVAWDIWLNGVGWGNGTSEFMIWTENFGQRPAGSIKTTVSLSGYDWDAWHYNDGNANVISLVSKTTIPSGSLDLKEMLNWAIDRGYMPANPTVNQIGFGVEICSTNNTKQRFTFTDFSVTMR
jgi:Glycosyl hydrolase family 12